MLQHLLTVTIFSSKHKKVFRIQVWRSILISFYGEDQSLFVTGVQEIVTGKNGYATGVQTKIKPQKEALTGLGLSEQDSFPLPIKFIA